MIEPQSLRTLRESIRAQMLADRSLIDAIRAEIRALRDGGRRIQPRTATAVSLVGTDGGNVQVRFDPFLVQLIRVVGSAHNEHVLEVVAPSMNVRQLEGRLFDAAGRGAGPLGEMMDFLGARSLAELSQMSRLSRILGGGALPGNLL